MSQSTNRPPTRGALEYRYASLLADAVVPVTSHSIKVCFRQKAHEVVWCTSHTSTLKKRSKSPVATPVALHWQILAFLWMICRESVYKQPFSTQDDHVKEDLKTSRTQCSSSKVEEDERMAEMSSSSSISDLKRTKTIDSNRRWAFWKKFRLARSRKESPQDDLEVDESTASMTIDESFSNGDCDWSLDSPKKETHTYRRKLFRRPSIFRRRRGQSPPVEKLHVPHTVVIQLREEVMAQTLSPTKKESSKPAPRTQCEDPNAVRARKCLNDLAFIIGA